MTMMLQYKRFTDNKNALSDGDKMMFSDFG